jgi:hypothetical protein
MTLPIALSVVLAGAGCTDTTRPAEDRTPRPSAMPSSPGMPQPSATSTGPVRPDPNYEHPDSPAGSELLTTFPTPNELGPGWGYADEELQSGAVVGAERDVGDIMQGSIPEGCPPAAQLPLPGAAAEVRYVFLETPVSVFVLGFPDRSSTRAFLSGLVENLVGCQGEKTGAGGQAVGRVDPLGEGIVMSERFPGEDRRRSDLAILTDRSVVLLEAPVRVGALPFTPEASAQIAETFRDAAREAPPWVTETG